MTALFIFLILAQAGGSRGVVACDRTSDPFCGSLASVTAAQNRLERTEASLQSRPADCSAGRFGLIEDAKKAVEDRHKAYAAYYRDWGDFVVANRKVLDRLYKANSSRLANTEDLIRQALAAHSELVLRERNFGRRGLDAANLQRLATLASQRVDALKDAAVNWIQAETNIARGWARASVIGYQIRRLQEAVAVESRLWDSHYERLRLRLKLRCTTPAASGPGK